MHAEGAPALAKTGQTIANVPDATIIKLYVDDEAFFLRPRGCRITGGSWICGPGR